MNKVELLYLHVFGTEVKQVEHGESNTYMYLQWPLS